MRSRRRCIGVCADLARQIVADGEGATVVLQIDVTGAAGRRAGGRDRTTDRDLAARQDGRVRTRPNWGRVVAAAGSAPWNGGFAELDPARLRVAFDGVTVLADGRPTGAAPTLSGAECRIELDLGLGTGTASYLASDLSYDYVRINAEYTT